MTDESDSAHQQRTARPLIWITSPALTAAAASSSPASLPSAASSTSLALSSIFSAVDSSRHSPGPISPATTLESHHSSADLAQDDIMIAIPQQPLPPPSLITRSAPGRPKLPRLNTGDKVTTLNRIHSSSNLPAHLAGDATIPSRAATADEGAGLKTSRPSSRNRSGLSSPISILTNLSIGHSNDVRESANLHPTSAYAPEFPSSISARGSNSSLRSAAAAAASPSSGFCATTASIFAAASLASSSCNSTASSPSSLRPPSDFSSSVGSNRTLSLSIKPPTLTSAPSRRPTLTLSPVGGPPALSPPRNGGPRRVHGSPLTLSPSGLTTTTNPPLNGGGHRFFSDLESPLRARSCFSLREHALDDVADSDLPGHHHHRPNSFSDSERQQQLPPFSHSPRERRAGGPPRRRGITLDTALCATRGGVISPPLPSAMDISSPWSVASAHCGGSPLTLSTHVTRGERRPSSGLGSFGRASGSSALAQAHSQDTETEGDSSPHVDGGRRTASSSSGSAGWQGSTRSLGSSNRSAFAVPDHLDRLRRSFLAASPPSSNSNSNSNDDGYESQPQLHSHSHSHSVSGRRRSGADYEGSSSGSMMMMQRRPPMSSSSAPPALNPTPIIPSLLYLGPAPSHATHWAELRALGVKRVLNVAEEVDLDVPMLGSGRSRRSSGGGVPEAEAAVIYKKVGIRDYVEEERVEDMLRQGSAFLNESIDAQEPIYVHCLAGRSRSPTAIIAYLIRYRAWSFTRAYGFVRELRGGGAVAAYSNEDDDKGELVAVKIKGTAREEEEEEDDDDEKEGGFLGQPFVSHFTRSAPVSASVLEDGQQQQSPPPPLPTKAAHPAPADQGGASYSPSPSPSQPQQRGPTRSPSSPSLSNAPPPSWTEAAATLSALATHSYHATNFAPNIGFVAELRRWETMCEAERVQCGSGGAVVQNGGNACGSGGGGGGGGWSAERDLLGTSSSRVHSQSSETLHTPFVA
ncbi:hypothetical protein A4X09_0g2229 [Tilletia walkeri]|uniref:protein-tyrosine-phosphatase n=1 Tax=Tilletia walkeri TaxID=117179 RepID=A0A8X7NCS5_9BASI|nr:hypothetical protein A4X09_0g2229 [Tilletia walkeri]